MLYEQEGKAGARSTVDLNICFPSLLYMVHEVGFFFFLRTSFQKCRDANEWDLTISSPGKKNDG